MSLIPIILAYSSLFILGLADNLRGPLFAEILTEFNLNYTTGSLLFALSSSFAFIGGLSSTWLLARLSHQSLLQIALGTLTIGLFGISISKDLESLLLSSAFFGISFGFMGVCQNALVTFSTTPRHRKQWLSGLHSMYALSSFLAPALVAWLASREGTWRDAFRLTALLPASALLLSLFMATKRARPESSSDLELDPHRNANFKLQLMAGFSFAFYTLTEILVSTRVGLFFRRELGHSLESASLKVSLFFLFLLIGRLIWTFIKMPWNIYHQMISSLFLSGVCLVLGLTWNPNLLVLSGLTLAPFYGLSVAYLSQTFKSKTNQAISLAMATQSIFVVAMHIGVGILSDQLDIKLALWVGPISLFLSFLFLWRVHEVQKA